MIGHPKRCEYCALHASTGKQTTDPEAEQDLSGEQEDSVQHGHRTSDRG